MSPRPGTKTRIKNLTTGNEFEVSSLSGAATKMNTDKESVKKAYLNNQTIRSRDNCVWIVTQIG